VPGAARPRRGVPFPAAAPRAAVPPPPRRRRAAVPRLEPARPGGAALHQPAPPRRAAPPPRRPPRRAVPVPPRAAPGGRLRLRLPLGSARGAPPATRPEKLLLVFARGVGADPARGFAEEFGAVEIDLLVDFVGEADHDSEEEEGWVSVSFHPNEDMRSFRAFEIDVVECGDEMLSSPLPPPPPPLPEMEVKEGSLGGEFSVFVGKMNMGSREMVNLDTTALVAIVSGISNGGVGKLMSIPEAETRARFKCNYKFVMDQAHSELQSPILVELGNAVDGKKCIICETVNSEFKEIVTMCGGPEEQTRSSQLLKRLIVVPDSPSARMMDLPTTRKLAMKNKVVFGTGDHWRAPTLTANMGFVRAVSQSGMPLLTIEHRPRALIGL
ncbi:hypothetical protein EE612_052017, partial [Oryza sativa]